MTEKEKLLRSLTARQRQIIKREYPRKKRRDALLKELRAQGVRVSVLSELSGINRTALYRVLDGKPEAYPRYFWKGRPDFSGLLAAFKNLVKELMKFIENTKK